MGIRNIEIVYDKNGESFSISDIRISIIVGFGLHQAWVFLTMFSPHLSFSTEAASLFENAYFSVSLGAFVLTFLLCAVFENRLQPLFPQRRTIIPAAALNALSTLAVMGGSIPGSLGIALFGFASIVSGIASATLILEWGCIFSRLDIPSCIINSALAFMAGIVIYILFFHAFSQYVSYVIAAFASLLEGGLLCYCSANQPSIIEGPFEVRALPIRKKAFARQICVPLLLFGIASGLFGQSSIRATLVQANASDQIVVVAAASLTALIFIIALFSVSGQQLNSLYRPLLPIVACSLLFVPQANTLSQLGQLGLIVGYLCLDVLTWITPCELCSQYRIGALLSFGLSRGCLAAGTLLVDGFQRLYYLQTGADLVLADFSIVAVVLVLLVAGYMLLPRKEDMQALANQRTDPKGSAQQSEDSARRNDAASFPETAASDNAAEETAAVNGSLNLASVVLEPDAQPPMSDKGPKARPERFAERCQIVADRFFLTGKETEILFLLAKGRNARYIQEQLFISENTVRTHMRHVYRKLDVHTQQELIDLVERAQ